MRRCGESHESRRDVVVPLRCRPSSSPVDQPPLPSSVLDAVEDHLRDDPDVSAGAIQTYHHLVRAGTPSGEPWVGLDVLAKARAATVASAEEWCSELEYSGVINQIISRYEPGPNAFYRRAIPYRSGS